MRDRDVRVALSSRLIKEHGDDRSTLTINELALCGRVRVDVAVVNGYLSGFELKSERDDLRRLPVQAEVYSNVLDQATLVVAEKHWAHAALYLPDWWGVIIARGSDAGVHLEVEREARTNPTVDPQALVRLLWREEALAELDDRGRADGVRSKPKPVIWQHLVELIQLDELRAIVRSRLKRRKGWRPDR